MANLASCRHIVVLTIDVKQQQCVLRRGTASYLDDFWYAGWGREQEVCRQIFTAQTQITEAIVALEIPGSRV